MQNMSMKKLLFIFGGFLLAIVLVTVVIASVAAKKNTGPHAVEHHPQRAVARAETASMPVVTDTSFGTVNPTPNALSGVPAVAPTVVRFNAPDAAINAAAAASATAANAKVDDELADHETRISALEAQRANARPNGTARPHHTSPSQRDQHLLSREAQEALMHPPQPNRVATDYRTLAVVGDRAWVAAPDGTTESVVVGDELPRPRVKAIRADTGAVITSSDTTVPSGH